MTPFLQRIPFQNEIAPSILQVGFYLFQGEAGFLRDFYCTIAFDIEQLEAAPLMIGELGEDGPDVDLVQETHFVMG
jgi:hypothetical protein